MSNIMPWSPGKLSFEASLVGSETTSLTFVISVKNSEGLARFYRHQMLGKLIDNYRCEQHHQPHKDNTTAFSALRFDPETEHQTAHCQQRAGVESAIVDDR